MMNIDRALLFNFLQLPLLHWFDTNMHWHLFYGFVCCFCVNILMQMWLEIEILMKNGLSHFNDSWSMYTPCNDWRWRRLVTGKKLFLILLIFNGRQNGKSWLFANQISVVYRCCNNSKLFLVSSININTFPFINFIIVSPTVRLQTLDRLFQ